VASPGVHGEVGTGRLEAFSDGVFAIAITLLILDVNVDPAGRGSLAHRLGHQWPSYASLLISFAVIGTIWINHHRMFEEIGAADHGVVVANLFLLLVVTVIPFPTRLVGSTLASGTAADQRTAVLVYGARFVGVSLAFPLLWLAASRGGGRLLAEGMTPARTRARRRRNMIGFPTYSAGTLIALASPKLSLAAFGVVMALYLLPSHWIDRRLEGRDA